MHKNIVLCDGLSPDYLQEIELFLTEWQSPTDFIEVDTSGSTGNPKTIKLSKKKILASAKATGSFFGFNAKQSLLLNLSPKYIAGKLMLVRALAHNMQIYVVPASQNPLLHLRNHQPSFAAFVPYQVAAILDNEITRTLYEGIPKVIIGGAPIPLALEKSLAKLKNDSYATFGMTETITHIALRKIEETQLPYTCLPGIKVSADENNCLIIHQNAVTERIVCNDVVEILDDSTFHWIGRADFIINSGGIKINPEKLERIMEPFLGGKRFYFHGRPSAVFGQEVVLYVEGKAENELELEEVIRRELEKYHQPKALVFVPAFQETATGKIIRQNY